MESLEDISFIIARRVRSRASIQYFTHITISSETISDAPRIS